MSGFFYWKAVHQLWKKPFAGNVCAPWHRVQFVRVSNGTFDQVGCYTAMTLSGSDV